MNVGAIVKAAYEQNLKRQKAYEQAIARLPRGSITTKQVKKLETGSYVYFYWVYRHNGKVVHRYISEKDNNIYELMQQVKQRRDLQSMLRELKKEQREMERYLRHFNGKPSQAPKKGPGQSIK